MEQFAKHIGVNVDWFFGLSFDAADSLARQHGYTFTAMGIVPLTRQNKNIKLTDIN